MRSTSFLAVATLALAISAGPAAAQAPPVRNLQLAFHPDGTVSLAAQGVSIREILAEWARQCGCYLVNWDKLAGGTMPVPVQFEHSTQAKVLESLLRQAAGYVLTAKRAGSTSLSNYETIYILPTSTAVAGAYVPPVSQSAPIMPMPTPGGPDDEIPAAGSQMGLRPPPPGQNQGQTPQAPGMPPPGMTPGMTPGMAPSGQFPRPASTPGVLVPIIPVSTPQSTTPSGQAPGTSAPPMPGPNAPAPPQGR